MSKLARLTPKVSVGVWANREAERVKGPYLRVANADVLSSSPIAAQRADAKTLGVVSNVKKSSTLFGGSAAESRDSAAYADAFRCVPRTSILARLTPKVSVGVWANREAERVGWERPLPVRDARGERGQNV